MPVLILLPASEGKTAAATGAALNLEELSFPQLTAARQEVIQALQEVSARPDSLTQLGLGTSLVRELDRNLRLYKAPAAPAHALYHGVLYDALDYAGMTTAQRRKAREAVIVFSGLWGAVGFADAIPAYRLSMSTALPPLGRLSGYWRHRLETALADRTGGELIVDCRSSSYCAAWAAPAEQTVEVKVFQLRNGKRSVVSHFAKHTRGELARHLLTRGGKAPATPQRLLRAAQERWQAELTTAPEHGRNPHVLSIILPEGVSFAKNR